METKTLYIKCDCHAHILVIEKDSKDDQYYISIFDDSICNSREWKRFLFKIKMCFKYLFRKNPFVGHVILNSDKLSEIHKFFNLK